MNKYDSEYEAALIEFSARVRKQVTNNRVQNLEFVQLKDREAFAFGFDSALSLLRQIAIDNGVEKAEIGLDGMPVTSLVKSHL